MRTDKELLDGLQVLLERKSYTGKILGRWSRTNRGIRLNETSEDGAVEDVRTAIENFLDENQKEN